MSEPALAEPDPLLRDDRLGIVLRRWRPGDIGALVDAWADPEIAAHCGVPVDAGPARAEEWISGWTDRVRGGVALDLVVADQVTDSVLGEVGLWPFRAPPNGAAVAGVLELGWWIGAPHRSGGRAAASVTLVADCALESLGAAQVVARIRPGHARSERIASRAGLGRRGPLDAGHDLWVRSAASIPV